MEFFILAAVDRGGLTTMYSLRRRAGLEPGGIRPALKNLEQEGFLHRSESGLRRRREFELSESGAQVLSHGWAECLRGQGEIDAILRSACVAELMADVKTSRAYLAAMASERTWQAQHRSLEAAHLPRRDPLSNYMWTRALCVSRRLEAESSALTLVSQGREPAGNE